MRIIAIDPGNEHSAMVKYSLDHCALVKGTIKSNAELAEFVYSLNYNSDEIYIEFPSPRGQLATWQLFETCKWVGRFEAEILKAGGKPHYVNRRDVWNFFQVHRCTRQEKAAGIKQVKFDAQIRLKIIDMYGGEQKAIGNKKCKKCGGKGWFGPGRPLCPECNGSGWKHPPGPLARITADMWQALAIAIMIRDEKKHEANND